jgi:soluble lytic murein transglycosylase-like protein
MKKQLLAGLAAAFLTTALVGGAQAHNACRDYGTCTVKKKVTHKKARTAKTYSSKKVKVRTASNRRLKSKRIRTQSAMAGVPRNRGHVVAMIKSQAPAYGVPTWFALRIAKIESNYNPRARGAAGEYGVYQMKCSTARGLGFRGNCSALLNPSTNVRYGLKHLSVAVRSSRGNLKLAASKHNGGLGRKRLVPRYVNLVF